MRELVEKFFTCQHCDVTFVATRPAKFCGSRCRTANHRSRQKPSILQAIVNHGHHDLIPRWNAVRQLSTYAEKLIVGIYDRYGYDAARMAIAAAHATYENIDIMTEADYQAKETAEAEAIAKRLAA